uniref:Ubiquitin-conjugating enzyme E2 2 n=1 Tax=Bionectria ochroleuca TaxID=29856 RepID=A0A8H7K7R5_BIOOC
MAQKRLLQELVPLQKEKWVHIEVDDANLFKWKLGLWVVNPESVWHGAFLKAEMRFPNDYPYQPPTFRFTTRDIFHPNIYPDGNLCISILHRPGDDAQSGELASERWNVLHGVESVLRSVLLLMDDPEINSPQTWTPASCIAITAIITMLGPRSQWHPPKRTSPRAWRCPPKRNLPRHQSTRSTMTRTFGT